MPVSKMRKLHPQERKRRNATYFRERIAEWKKTREGKRQMKKYETTR